MKYSVVVDSDIINRERSIYQVDADSKDSAKALITDKLSSDYRTNVHVVAVEKSTRIIRIILSYFFLCVAVLLSVVNWENGHEFISIKPNLISCIFAIGIYVIFIARFKEIKFEVGFVWDIIFIPLIILLLSSFVRLMLVNHYISVFGLFTIPIRAEYLLYLTVVLFLVGVKKISFLSLLVICFLALSNITAVSIAMKGMGPVYAISAFMGLLLYFSIEPSVQEIFLNISKTTGKLVHSFDGAVPRFDVPIGKNK